MVRKMDPPRSSNVLPRLTTTAREESKSRRAKASARHRYKCCV